ncbi:hypothetical protein A5696_15430 [Mycobacterium sp. E2699]|nr:hypothetical protein A5696_15430 [Mycobacterium sp. E2699]
MSARKMLAEHDRMFVEFARTLAPSDWKRQSLCSEWSNHDVLAHLVKGYSISLPSLGSALFANRGSFDRANTAVARRLAGRQTPAELIDTFAGLIEHPKGIGKRFPAGLLLGDHVLHHLDIALPLGREILIPGRIVDAVLDIEVRVPNPFVPAKSNAAGLSLRTTDTGWSFTDGRAGADSLVEGHGIHVAAALGGRRFALPLLGGAGVARLTDRLI